MRSLLEKAKDELTRRVPGQRSAPAKTADRVECRARRTARGATRLGRRTGSALRSGLGEARDLAKDRIRRARRAERRRNRKKAGAVAATGASAAAGAYFLDPNSGKRRRHMARDRIAGLFRRATGRVERAGRYGAHTAAGKAKGAVAGVAPEKPAPNDEALADRVRSEVFRPAEAPKGHVNINVEDGIVYIRGDAGDPKQIRELIRKAEKVDGVRRVENLISPG